MTKSFFSLIALALVFAAAAFPQTPKAAKHKAVFELNAPAPSGWDQLFHNVENVQKVFAADGTQVEIVFFGQGLRMLLKTNSEYAERLKAAADSGVVLAACQNTMRAMKVTGDDLFPFATQVDSGVAELVCKRKPGLFISRAVSKHVQPA